MFTWNKKNSTTPPQTQQPRTMSDGDICSDDERYGGQRRAHLVGQRSPSPSLPPRASGKQSAPTSSARKSLTCLPPLRRLQRPLKRPRPFLRFLPLTMLWRGHLRRKSHPPSSLPRPLWRPRPFRLASPSIRVCPKRLAASDPLRDFR